jgi:hypothetical protein
LQPSVTKMMLSPSLCTSLQKNNYAKKNKRKKTEESRRKKEGRVHF